jgi:NAD(P)-dependent dehydrogenase (short-subunit alcohol dehydrogenase family)
MSARLDGKVVVVTGSTKGIGRAIAHVLAAEGARVVVNSRDEAAVREVVSGIGESAAGVVADVSTEAGAEHLINAAVTSFGRLDILVNNAGMNVVSDALDLQPADWRRIIDLNLTGPFLCSQLAARVMLAGGSGVIVNIASVTAFAPFPRRVAYASSKAALVMMTRVMASELAPTVRVNAVAPGYVRTAMTERLSDEGKLDFAALERRTPQGRLGEPEEVAKAVLFLCSDDAAYVTGETLVVDGGWLSYGFV